LAALPARTLEDRRRPDNGNLALRRSRPAGFVKARRHLGCWNFSRRWNLIHEFGAPPTKIVSRQETLRLKENFQQQDLNAML
jgi:hypothetical protein